MSSHDYYPTNEKCVFVCAKCGCYVYNCCHPKIVKTNQLFSSPKISENTSELNRKIDYENNYHANYILNRKKGICNIHILVKLLNLNKTILYKSITYLDTIFLKEDLPSKEVDDISTICVLLAVKFNESIKNPSLKNLIDIAKTIPNYKELEIKCLKALDYDLSILSAYDYINCIFHSGIFFDHDYSQEDVTKCYKKCIRKMEDFIEDMRAIDFSNYTIAITIIRTMFRKKDKHLLKAFNYVYKIKEEDEMEITKCDLIIKCIKRFNKTLKFYNVTRQF